MGNCCGRRSSVSQSSQSSTDKLLVHEAKGHVGTGTNTPRGNDVRVSVEEVDGVPVYVSVDVERPRPTQRNTPAIVSFPRDEAFDPNTILQRMADRLSELSTRPLRLARIQYVPSDQWATCSYCDNPTGDRYDYFLCPNMPMSLLDTLMENGWWRTGEVIFKPCFPVVCCPGYQMRLPVAKFVVKKQHRQVIRKWASFLRNGDSRWDTRSSRAETSTEEEQNSPLHTEAESTRIQTAVSSAGIKQVEEGVRNGYVDSRGVTTRTESLSRETAVEEAGDVSQSQGQRRRRIATPGLGADPNKPPCRKAKQVREERRQKKLETKRANNGSTSYKKSTQPQPAPPSLHELLVDHREAERGEEAGFKHKLQVKLLACNPRHPELTRTLDKAYDLYNKFQNAVHPGKTRFKSANDFEWGFMRSPIRNSPNTLQGSYHVHYYLDDELIMISIVDILPKYFVSIYFIYDPDIRFMTPGVYTILVELDLVRQLAKTCPSLQYYILGYYNPNPKVCYKRQFKPQELLCNETHVFVPMEAAIPKIALKPYVRLVDDEVPEKEGRTASIDNLIVDMRFAGLGTVPYRMLDSRLKKLYEKPLRRLITETGSIAAHELIISVRISF